MAIDQRMLAEYLRRQQQQGMSLGRPPITMESQVNALANQPVAPGMVGAYVDQSKPDPRAKSFTGEESRIKSQRAMANMLRGKEAPKGKTVGPYDLYMGPNWGESLAYAGEQALGGYMAGKANRDDIALDEERGLVKAAELAAEDAKDERDFNLKLDEYNRDIYEYDTDSSYRANQDTITNKLASELQDFNKGKGKTKTYMTPDGPLTVIEDQQGLSWMTDAQGGRVGTIDVSGFKPLNENRQVNLTAAELEALEATTNGADSAIFGITNASDIFRADNDLWNDGTGLGAESLFTGLTGYGSPSKAGPRVLEFQRKVQKLGFEGMSEDFNRLELGQIAKNEFDSVAKANANWKTEPYGLVNIQIGKLPLYRKAFNKAIAAGTHTNDQRDIHMRQMEDDVIYGATQIDQKTGKPTVSLDELRRKGINVPDRRAQLAKKVENGTFTPEDKALLTQIIMAQKAEEE